MFRVNKYWERVSVNLILQLVAEQGEIPTLCTKIEKVLS